MGGYGHHVTDEKTEIGIDEEDLARIRQSGARARSPAQSSFLLCTLSATGGLCLEMGILHRQQRLKGNSLHVLPWGLDHWRISLTKTNGGGGFGPGAGWGGGAGGGGG